MDDKQECQLRQKCPNCGADITDKEFTVDSQAEEIEWNADYDPIADIKAWLEREKRIYMLGTSASPPFVDFRTCFVYNGPWLLPNESGTS